MKCQIQWVDADGKPTPDANDAVMMAHFHELKPEPGPGRTNAKLRCEYTEKVASSYPVCAKHLAMVKYNWRYGAGGGWSFSPIEE